MTPIEIPVTKAAVKLRKLVAPPHESLHGCNCGWYGFKSASCPHLGFEDAHKCGLTISRITGRPIFCRERPPKLSLPQYVVSEMCESCIAELEEQLDDALEQIKQESARNSPS